MEHANYSYLGANAPVSSGAESVTAFPCSFIAFMKNDGAADVLVAFDQPTAEATVGTKPITLKAGETMTNIPIRTAKVALKSTGAASAVRILGLY